MRTLCAQGALGEAKKPESVGLESFTLDTAHDHGQRDKPGW